MRTVLILSLVGLWAGSAADEAPLGSLTVGATGLRRGKLGCMLFDQRRGFPNKVELSARNQRVRIVDSKAECLFDKLPAGRYAVALMHDENGNGKLDTSFFGSPQEGYGFSNGAKAHAFSPATFEEARFTLPSAHDVISIPIVYP